MSKVLFYQKQTNGLGSSLNVALEEIANFDGLKKEVIKDKLYTVHNAKLKMMFGNYSFTKCYSNIFGE